MLLPQSGGSFEVAHPCNDPLRYRRGLRQEPSSKAGQPAGKRFVRTRRTEGCLAMGIATRPNGGPATSVPIPLPVPCLATAEQRIDDDLTESVANFVYISISQEYSQHVMLSDN